MIKELYFVGTRCFFSQPIEVPVGSGPKPSFVHCSYGLQKYGHIFIFIVGLQRMNPNDEPGQNFNHNYRRSSARFQKRRKRLKLYFLTWRFIFNFKHVFVIKKMILFFLIVRMYYRASGMLSTSSILIFMEKYSK